MDIQVFATTTCGSGALAGRSKRSRILSGLYLVSAAGGTLHPFPKGYPNLSSRMVTHIAHMDQDQSTDRSGEYLVYGDVADASTFASGMGALGFRSSVQGQVNLTLVASHNPDIVKAYGGMMGALVALVMAAVFSRTRRYGIPRLHGHSWLHHATRETLHAVSAAIIGMGATALISLPVLGFYNGLAQWMRWFRWSIQIWIPSIAVLLIIDIVTLAIAWSSAGILAQVKGRMTSLPVFSASYLLRFPVAMLAILLIISVTSAARELRRYEDQQDQWTTADRHVGRVTLRGIGSAVIDAAGEKRMVEAVGAWLGDVDEHRGLIIANLSPVDVGLPAPIQMFIINDEYCQRHPVPACASSPNTSAVTGTVPASLSPVEPRIRHAVAQQLCASTKAGKATIKWSRQEGSRDYFTYGPQTPNRVCRQRLPILWWSASPPGCCRATTSPQR
ncbi:hypothetical protein PA08_1048 [Cutibacterium modestum P08]|nr:hypothetical protein PA08_1048 [Cutibacterium modestum P08]